MDGFGRGCTGSEVWEDPALCDYRVRVGMSGHGDITLARTRTHPPLRALLRFRTFAESRVKREPLVSH